MKLNLKKSLSAFLALFLVFGQGSMWAKDHQEKGKELGKKADKAKEKTKEKGKELGKKVDKAKEKAKEKGKEVVDKVKDKAEEVYEKGKEKAHELIHKS